VSRSHQNQSFQIRVAPDTASNPLDNDVSAVLSPPVVVRSKRNNRKKSNAPLSSLLAPLDSSSAPYASLAPLGALNDDGTDEAAATLIAVRSFTPRSYIQDKVEAEDIPQEQLNNSKRRSASDALSTVSDWMSTMMKTVEGLKWSEEYEKFPDGTSDRSRPRYTMRNPNHDIENIMRV
jgi:hypothetical protein